MGPEVVRTSFRMNEERLANKVLMLEVISNLKRSKPKLMLLDRAKDLLMTLT